MSTSPWTRNLFVVLRTFLALAFPIVFLSNPTVSFAQNTNFAVGTNVQQANVLRLGVNLSRQDYYDSGQMLRDITMRNPGFEGQQWQTILHCVAVTAMTCTDGNGWNVWPANTIAGATFEVVNGPAAGETGTIASQTGSDYANGNQTNPVNGLTATFSAPLATPLAVDDFIIVRMEEPGNPTFGWWTSTNGGGQLLTDSTDIAPDSPGKQALEISAAGSGQSAGVTSYFDSSAGRSFLQLQGTYTLTFKAKGLGGNNQINVSAGRYSSTHGTVSYLNQNVSLTNQWQDYSFTFTANEDGTYIGTAFLSFLASGASLDLDDVALTEAADADNPTAYRNAVVDRLRQLKPGVLRLMDGQDLGSTIDNELAVPFARQTANFSSQGIEQDDIPMGLHEFLVLCQTIGAEPFFTMPGGMSVSDMQHLMEYLGGSSSTTYGAIRASLGQSAPWTSVFPVIHLELGNEMWNTSGFLGEQMADPVAYGYRTGVIFGAARSSPYYDASSFDLVMSGWAANTWWVQQEIQAAGSVFDSVDAAPYQFDTFSDYSSNENIYGPMFAQPEQDDSVAGGYMVQQQQMAAAANTKLDVYEVNLGTEAGTAPQNEVTDVVGSVGAGIAMADHMLLMMRDLGITVQNAFALTEFTNGFTNTASGGNETMPLWGTTIDMGGETNANRPTFLAEQLANSAILPTMLSVTVTGANPTWSQALSANDTVNPIQLANAHYLQSFAFTDGTRYSVIVMNLSRSGSLPVTFSGQNAPTGDVLVSQLTSQNITDNNENLTTNSPVVNTTQSNVSNFNPATPYSLPPFSMTVFSWPGSTLPSSNTVLTASPTQANAGQSVTLTANVSSQSGTTTPTGTVTFMDGSTALGTGTLNGSGVATLSTTSLPAGADSITASYGGDSNDASSVSQAVTVNVGSSAAVATTTTLTASPTQANTGQNVTMTATVAAKSGSMPAGTVTFLDGTTTLGTGTLNGSGVATLSTTSLPAGTDSITASYAGNTNDAASVSSAVSVTITSSAAIATTTTLTASPTQANAGQNVTLTATVAAKSGSTPTGTVTFLNSGTTIGTGTLNGSGVATLSTTSLPAGTDAITASYAGNTNDAASASSAVSVTINSSAASTTTTLTASPTQTNAGQNVTLTATVAAKSGSTPTGTVTFLNSGMTIGTGTLNGSGVATFSTTSLPAGTDAITASYAGNTNDAASASSAVLVTINSSATSTTTTLTASPTQANAGQNVTLTATVAAKSGSTPTGTVTFLNSGTTIGTGTLNGSGVATLSTTSLPAGTDSITASYTGNTNDAASVSSAVSVTINSSAASTTTTLTASPTQTNSGQNVTLTATVAAQSGRTPAGTVTFLNGTTTLGTGTLKGRGVATFSTTSLPAGTDSITASYAGNSNDAASASSTVAVTIEAASSGTVATTTSLTASGTQITAGQNLIVTATVAPQSGSTVPTGSVTFLDGTTSLGVVALNDNGAATFSTSSLSAGTHSITASYGGNSSDSSSVSNAVSVQVTVALSPAGIPSAVSTATTLSASASQVTAGQNLTLTATVAAQSGSTVPTGSVIFLDGSTTLGTAQLNGSGAASFSTSGLSAGVHSITASYGGSTSDSGSVSNAVSVQVAAASAPPTNPTTAATTTTLAASASQVAATDPLTLTATVAEQGASGIPTGTVQFLDGGTAIGTGTLSGGTATFTTTSLAVGTHTITASYGGDSSNSASSSSAVTISVAQAGTPEYSMTVSSSDVSVKPGGVANLTVTVTPENGFKMPVNLTCNSPLAGTTCSFSPPTVTPNGGPASSTLSILVASSSKSSSQNAANQAPATPFDHRTALGMVMPWGLVSLLGLSRRKNRSRAKTWALRIIVGAALTAGSLWVSGCGYQVNSSNFTMTLTSSGANVPTHTSQITVNVLQ